MQSRAATVAEYLASLPDDRRAAVAAVRKVILANLDKGYAEIMSYGMIGYAVPHSLFPAGYHCDPRQPLPFAALASQKGHLSLYMMGLYCGCDGEGETNDARWFREAWLKTGRKLDMGKACIRFKRVEDVPLEVIGEAIRRVPAKLYIQRYEEVMEAMGKGVKKGPTNKAATKKAPAAKKAPAKKKVAKKRGA